MIHNQQTNQQTQEHNIFNDNSINFLARPDQPRPTPSGFSLYHKEKLKNLESTDKKAQAQAQKSTDPRPAGETPTGEGYSETATIKKSGEQHTTKRHKHIKAQAQAQKKAQKHGTGEGGDGKLCEGMSGEELSEQVRQRRIGEKNDTGITKEAIGIENSIKNKAHSTLPQKVKQQRIGEKPACPFCNLRRYVSWNINGTGIEYFGCSKCRKTFMRDQVKK